MRINLIIPVFNEEKNLYQTLKNTLEHFKSKDIIVANDGSIDNTMDIVRNRTTVEYISEPINKGKGYILRKGCDYAFAHGADAVIVMDGDGQHSPEMLPYFVKQLKEYDVVLSYRDGRGAPVFKQIGNFGINLVTKLLYFKNIKDTQCGFRAFTKKGYQACRWSNNNYSMESETISLMLKKKIKFTQIQIPTIYLDPNKGTKISDGFKIMLNVIYWRLKG